jgi:hypothetical protein
LEVNPSRPREAGGSDRAVESFGEHLISRKRQVQTVIADQFHLATHERVVRVDEMGALGCNHLRDLRVGLLDGLWVDRAVEWSRGGARRRQCADEHGLHSSRARGANVSTKRRDNLVHG